MLEEMLDNIHRAYENLMLNGEEMMPASICMLIQILIDKSGIDAAKFADFIATSVKEVNEREILDF